MIELTYNTIFLIYLILTMTIVLGVWMYSHYLARQRTFFPLEKTLFICEYCHFAYVEEDVKRLNRCPQCGLLNKENNFQK